MKICPNCHAELDDGMLFCNKCGSTVSSSKTTAKPPQKLASPQKAPKAVPSTKKSKTLLIVCIITALTILAASGLVAFFLLQPSGDSPAGGTSHQVTFQLNDGSGGTYEMQVVNHESKVSKPANPQKLGHTFSGWFTDATATVSYDFNNPVTQDLTLYASWTEPVEDGYLFDSSSGGGTIFSVSNLAVSDGVLRSTINVNEACTLRVKFLDENNNSVLHSMEIQTPAYCEMTTLSVPVDFELPEHYIIEGVLVDTSGQNLCESFANAEKTTVFEEHLKLTIHDFPDDTVLNFDKREDMNFGVLADDILILNAGKDRNIVSSEIYDETEDDGMTVLQKIIVKNPDSSVKSLTVGTKVLFKDTSYLLKIGEIQIEDDGTIVLLPAQDTSLVDFYQVLKIESTFDTDPTPAAPANPAHALVSINVEDKRELSLGIPVEIRPTKWLKIDGKLSGKASIEVKVHINAGLFSGIHYYAALIAKKELTLEVGIYAVLDNKDEDKSVFKPFEIPLGRIIIPTPVPGLTASIRPKFVFEWSLEGGLSLELSTKTKVGFVFSNGNKQFVDEKERSAKFTIEAKAELKAGIQTEVSADICGDALRGVFTVFVGAELTAEAEHGGNWSDQYKKHACALCVEGEAKWVAEMSVSAKYNFKIIKGSIFELKIARLMGVLGRPKFFVSLINDADSNYNGNVTFGWNECENNKYRVDLSVKNPISGTDMALVPITVYNSKETEVGSNLSPCHFYLYNGKYTATFDLGGKTYEKTFEVDDQRCTVALELSVDGTLSGKVCKAADRSVPISGATVTIYANDAPLTQIFTDANGNYSVPLPSGSYWVTVGYKGYLQFGAYATVQPVNTTYMETFLMIDGEQGTKGFAGGQVINSLMGKGEQDVTLSFRQNWNNTDDSAEVVATAKTSADGWYSIELPVGNYTVKATKDGFTASYFNVIVQGGTTDNQNGIITPDLGEGAGNQFRITLRWGETPTDLDSHLEVETSGGNSFHLDFSNKNVYDGDNLIGTLDYDDTLSYGPEHITVVAGEGNVYYYYVRHFLGEGSLVSSGAQVLVEQGNALVALYNIPGNLENNVYWNVFAIKDGELIVKNTLTSVPDTDYAD